MPPTSPIRVVVVGSLNMDLVLRVDSLPRLGETTTAAGLQTVPGGKGANQAVALARLGARVIMIGRVGDDAYGERLLQGVAAEGIDIEHVRRTPDCTSGLAVITVASSGENTIVIIAGANARVTAADLKNCEAAIRDANLVVIQNEIPMATLVSVVLLAKQYSIPVVFDPAPAPREPLPECLWGVDVLTPNQTEAETLAGFRIHSTADAVAAARSFRQRGAQRVVIKLGERGAIAVDTDDRLFEVPAAKVEVVDTTAAGDAFTAAMSVSLGEGSSLAEAVRRGCAAGTLAVMRVGAQPSLPTRAEVEEFLARRFNVRESRTGR